MARKPTDKQLFKMKNEWLGQFYEEVKPKDFYRAVFPEGSFEREGHPEDEKCNGVLTVIEGEKARNYIVFDELNMVDEVKGAEFAIMSPVGYSGRNRTAKNARWLYGIAVDLDGVEMEQLRDVFHQMKHDFLPQCTYCVNSGHGLHLYYLFEKPVPLYRHLQDQLREFKYELIRKIWNRYTSTYTEREQVQYQGIFQGFRMVGTQSKLGKRYPVTAFETGERVTVEYLTLNQRVAGSTPASSTKGAFSRRKRPFSFGSPGNTGLAAFRGSLQSGQFVQYAWWGCLRFLRMYIDFVDFECAFCVTMKTEER